MRETLKLPRRNFPVFPTGIEKTILPHTSQTTGLPPAWVQPLNGAGNGEFSDWTS